MFLAEEFLHAGSTEDGLLILTFTSRSGQPHEIALPEDQAAALAASLLAIFAAKAPGTVRGIQTRYINAEVGMGQGPNRQAALVTRYGPLQLMQPLSQVQASSLKRSLEEHEKPNV